MRQQADLAPGLPDDLAAHDAEALVDGGVLGEGAVEGGPQEVDIELDRVLVVDVGVPVLVLGRRRPCWLRSPDGAALVVDEVGRIGGHEDGALAVHQRITSLAAVPSPQSSL